jgi:hypothetical protein
MKLGCELGAAVRGSDSYAAQEIDQGVGSESARLSSIRVQQIMLVLKRAFRPSEWQYLKDDSRFTDAVRQMRTMDDAEDVIKLGLILLDEITVSVAA